MESTAKGRYLIYCESDSRAYIPLFSLPWYLDIVCDHNWDVALEEKHDKIQGFWTFQNERKGAFHMIRMPAFTPSLGPVVFPLDRETTTYKENSHYYNTLRALEKQLPKHSYIRINTYPDRQPWFPFYGLNYSQSTRYSYIIYHKRGIADVQKNLKKQVRNVVTKKEHSANITKAENTDILLPLLQDTFATNGIENFFDSSKMKAIMNTAMEKGCGTIWQYNDDSGIFIVEDEKKAYLLFTAANDVGKTNEHVACLIWHAIKDVISRNKDFDFEGSMIPGVEKFFRGFGGEQVPYHQLTKINSPLLRIYKLFRP